VTYSIEVSYCGGAKGQLQISDGEAYDLWATLADCLLTGEDMNLNIRGESIADKHPVRVSLVWSDPLDVKSVMLVSEAYLICEHYAQVDKEKRAKSSLILPGGSKV
jgi:hypothetical protein